MVTVINTVTDLFVKKISTNLTPEIIKLRYPECHKNQCTFFLIVFIDNLKKSL